MPWGSLSVFKGILRDQYLGQIASEDFTMSHYSPKVGGHPVDGGHVADVSDDIEHVGVSTGNFVRMLLDELLNSLGVEEGILVFVAWVPNDIVHESSIFVMFDLVVEAKEEAIVALNYMVRT